MGTYYYLVNDSKKLIVHLDYHVKYGPLTSNRAVHYAFANYLMHNQGDSFRLLADSPDISEEADYQKLNLLEYKFEDKFIMENIVNMLNEIYGYKQYIVKDGMGVDVYAS